MTAHEKFIADRNRIVDALGFSDIHTIQFNKDAIPKQLPCAIVILDSETGKNGTSRQYVSTDLAWTVFLIVNAQNVWFPVLSFLAALAPFPILYLIQDRKGQEKGKEASPNLIFPAEPGAWKMPVVARASVGRCTGFNSLFGKTGLTCKCALIHSALSVFVIDPGRIGVSPTSPAHPFTRSPVHFI